MRRRSAPRSGKSSRSAGASARTSPTSQIGCLRSLGLAARYVSGYLLTNPPPGQERLIGADMSHAWLSVFHPGFGWIDFDPTNDVIPREKHITLAWGRDYDDVSPIKGVILGGGRHSISVGVVT